MEFIGKHSFSIDSIKIFGIIGRKKERKMMKNAKMKIVEKIVGLRFELDNYRNDKDWDMVRKIRLEIASLENMLSETY